MVHRVSENLKFSIIDADKTADGNGATVSLAGVINTGFILVVTTAASSGITAQFQVSPDGTTWTDIGTSVSVGASQTNAVYAFDLLLADAQNTAAGADNVRAVYSGVSGTVRADLYQAEIAQLGKPPSWANTPQFLGHSS